VTAAALLALALTLAPPPAEAGPGRRGQVVRVERSRRTADASVHLCYRAGGRGEAGMVCLGSRPPRIGTRIGLVGLGALGAPGNVVHDNVRVIRTEPAREDTCGSGRLHAVTYEDSGRIGGPQAQFMIGLSNVDIAEGTTIDMNGALRPPGVDPGERLLGFDAPGESDDIVISGRPCDDGGAARPDARVQCLRYWRGGGDRWKVLGEDVMVECGSP
jgi:hypothetical protein